MNVKILPGRLSGDVIIPPSKSLAHRAIIAASLAKGKSVISNVAYSEDILATIEGMKALGANITKYDDYVEIIGSDVKRVNSVIDANESGSTLRFLIPIALVNEKPITFVGHNRLVNRPLDVYFDLFKKQNIKYCYPKDSYLPLEIEGKLHASEFCVPGDVSSQFITGLLYTLPLLDGDSKIIITTKLESKGYIDLTVDMLKKFGIEIEFNDNVIYVKGNQEYKPYDYVVEGDFSQSAFFFLANMLGNDINLVGMNLNSYQGDKKILEDVKAFGGALSIDGNKMKFKREENHGATISFAQSPDLGPALTVLASVSDGVSKFVDGKRLRIKECDRITCMKEELNKLGANIEEFESGMDIVGVSKLHGGTVDSHNDHRLVMSLAMVSTIIDSPLTIINAGAVKKSFPNFFDVFESLGGKVIYE